MTDRRPQRRQPVPLPAALGGLFSRQFSARAAALAWEWRARGLVSRTSGPRDWSPDTESPPADGLARPQRAQRRQAERMPPAQRIANYSQCGRAHLTGRQIARARRKARMTEAEILGLCWKLTAPAGVIAQRRSVDEVETILL